MELRDYLRVLRARWVSIVLVTMLALAGAGVASLLLTPQYEASTKLFVSTSSGDAADPAQSEYFVQQRVRSYPDVITSSSVLEPVVEQFGLD